MSKQNQGGVIVKKWLLGYSLVWLAVVAFLLPRPAGPSDPPRPLEALSVPVGGIIMWSGPVGQVPPGWALCDGTQGTPDLRGRFVIGAGGKYQVGERGGSEEHYHGINTTQYGVTAGWTFYGTATRTDRGGELPPYHALVYIMRLGGWVEIE